MVVHEISQINITSQRSQLRLPATSTNWKLDAKWHWIDNYVIAIVRQEVDEQLDYQQGTSQLAAKQKPAVNFMIFIRRMLLLGGQLCIRSMLMKDSVE